MEASQYDDLVRCHLIDDAVRKARHEYTPGFGVYFPKLKRILLNRRDCGVEGIQEVGR
jgi:hypothetical protein